MVKRWVQFELKSDEHQRFGIGKDGTFLPLGTHNPVQKIVAISELLMGVKRARGEAPKIYGIELPSSILDERIYWEIILSMEKLVHIRGHPRHCGINLYASKLSALPLFMCRASNLTSLDLSFTKNLLELPCEIGNLAKLKSLRLEDSGIKELPSSIGRLQNLEYLDLSHTSNLRALPKEIGNLTKLKKLHLHGSKIRELRGEDARVFLLVLTKRHRLLQSLRFYYFPSDGRKNFASDLTQIYYGLSCNRMRARLGLVSAEGKVIPPIAKLWPLLVSNKKLNSVLSYCVLGKADIIYRILIDGTESFLDLLMNGAPEGIERAQVDELPHKGSSQSGRSEQLSCARDDMQGNATHCSFS